MLSNISSCEAVVQCVRTTLGPRGMDKLIVDQRGNPTISNDGATILKKLEIVHPAAKTLVDIAKSQDAEVSIVQLQEPRHFIQGLLNIPNDFFVTEVHILLGSTLFKFLFDHVFVFKLKGVGFSYPLPKIFLAPKNFFALKVNKTLK